MARMPGDDPARIAAGYWFVDEMEECERCGRYVPWDQLEALIGTPPICPACRKKELEARLEELQEAAVWPLGLS